MNDPDLLRRISNEAIAFDRAHFDDGIDPAPVTMVEHHLRLTTDRKLITRLQPRFAVALGFFEGYAKAVLDLAVKSEPKNIGIVVKPKPPPPPPPPVAPPKSDELRMGIDDELAQAAVHIANDLLCYSRTIAQDLLDDMASVRRAVAERGTREMGSWEDIAIAFVEGARWQFARIENARAGDEPTMHFPPAFDRPSMPSDEEIVKFLRTAVYPNVPDPIEAERGIKTLNATEDELRRNIPKLVSSLAEACAIKLALLHFLSPANECSDAERTQYEMTLTQQKLRIEELQAEVASCKATIEATAVQAAKWRDRAERSDAIDSSPPLVFRDEGERDFWDEQAHTLNRRGDRSPSDVARAADEMVEERRKRMPKCDVIVAPKEYDDELLLEAASYANEFCELKPDRTDLQNAKSAMNGNTVVELRWSNAVRSYVNGAIRKARET